MFGLMSPLWREIMAEGGEERLPDLYEKMWSCWETLDSTEEPSSSYNVQVHVTRKQCWSVILNSLFLGILGIFSNVCKKIDFTYIELLTSLTENNYHRNNSWNKGDQNGQWSLSLQHKWRFGWSGNKWNKVRKNYKQVFQKYIHGVTAHGCGSYGSVVKDVNSQ